MLESHVTIVYHTGKAQTGVLQAPWNRHPFYEDEKGIAYQVRDRDNHLPASAEVLQAKWSIFWRGCNQPLCAELPCSSKLWRQQEILHPCANQWFLHIRSTHKIRDIYKQWQKKKKSVLARNVLNYKRICDSNSKVHLT